ncbi:cation transport regulator ChaB [Dietzia alimentaria]|jgi:cation transport regulator ChaB|uniref:ChaB family protein n=1 Tax=unclassified Dietzia TaxID=2617939 RepID=UPI0001F64DA8|nr:MULTISPECIES: ChaB family protein [Dietzia]EFV90514.1 ChaB protein [Dietzia cinnamea P4]MBC7305337.1 ChaB family protein [Dietzia sp.]ODQ96810.1 cation transport regulator ChaB [Dietzia alimentaria]AVM63875.1 cation transport regulator ChaB [Dietzia sp. oral taxon 368]MBB1020458.1 cation transport regulator ChaB [Dietzia sp. E1]
MPKTDSDGNAKDSELPSTLQRSDQKAKDTFAKAYDSAEEQYGDESRVARTAWGAVKHTHEKVGDHWEPKDGKGPSDSRSESGGPNPSGESKDGVDANASKDHLYEQAQKLGIEGRSDMTKDELVEALRKADDRKTEESRDDS